MSSPKYRFYATLLDSFQSYLSSSEIYQKYYGFSENPQITESEFEDKTRQNLLNTINRVPFESEAADRGTCFNEIVDCLILNRGTQRADMQIAYNREVQTITAIFKGKEYVFPTAVCREFANYFVGALPQVFCSAILPTVYGDVELYGFIDELMPFSIHDIKTTGRYQAGNFRNHWQHRVYPYAIEQMGNRVEHFEYNIAEITSSGKISTFTEYYPYAAEQVRCELKSHCEWFIEFLESNRDKITDRKIFNLE